MWWPHNIFFPVISSFEENIVEKVEGFEHSFKILGQLRKNNCSEQNL